MRPPNVHILGLGSVGAVFSHLLRTAHPSAPLFYLSRRSLPKRTSASRDTFTIHEPLGAVKQLSIINDTNGTTPLEILLITTKAHQTKDALSDHSHRISKDTLVIFLQNGMGIVDSVKPILASTRIIQGTTVHAVYRLQNEIHWVSKGNTFFAPQPGTILTSEEDLLLGVLGEVVPDYADFERRLFWKLAINACINPVTAIYGVLNGKVADIDSKEHDLSRRLTTEIQKVYAKLRPDMDMSNLVQEVIQVARETGMNTSSMLADIQAGRKTEIDFINGYIVKMGHSVDVDVHENEAIVLKIKELGCK